MDFLRIVKLEVGEPNYRTAQERWWDKLQNGAAHFPDYQYLITNIERDRLFEQIAQLNEQMRIHGQSHYEYEQRFPDLDNAVEVEIRIINDTTCMVCQGPPAKSIGDILCRLISFENLRYLLQDSRTYSRIRKLGKKERWIWVKRLREEKYYRSQLNQSLEIRGRLPNAFWTSEEDIANLGATLNKHRLADFLGMEGPRVGIHLLLRISSNRLSTRVPCGWDAFTNPHFRNSSGKNPPYGRTRDLETNPRKTTDGAREIVSRPVRIQDTLVPEPIE